MIRILAKILPGRCYEALRVGFPGRVVRWYRTRKPWLVAHILPIFAVSGILSSLYYFLFSRQFDREQRAVLAGRIEHARGSLASNRFEMRRRIHAIEKALLMRPRRNVFGRTHAYAAVMRFARALKRNDGILDEELQWAYDVLSEFFSTVASHPEIDAARNRFEELTSNSLNTEGKIPYVRDLDDQPVSIEAFEQLSLRRRSVRWFEKTEVDRSKVDRAVEIARQSPSACNRQPYRFRIYDDPAVVAKVNELLVGTQGFGENIPMIAAVVGDLCAYANERDRHLIYIDSALAAMSFIYALECQGLSSCVLNWADIGFRERGIAQLLSLSTHERVVMCIGIGHPLKEAVVANSTKRPLPAVRSYNQ